jgi:cell division protein FtsI/penicillin-binding protein 2
MTPLQLIIMTAALVNVGSQPILVVDDPDRFVKEALAEAEAKRERKRQKKESLWNTKLNKSE